MIRVVYLGQGVACVVEWGVTQWRAQNRLRQFRPGSALRISALLLSFFLFSTPDALGAPARRENLRALAIEESYRLALDRAETLKITEQSIREAEARYSESVSAVYPQIAARATEDLQDTWRDSNGSDTGSRGGSRDSSRFLAGITLSQPIFSGFRDRLLIEAADKELQALRLENIRSKEVLYEDVGKLFYQILFYEGDLAELQRSSKTLSERIRDLRHFVDLGKSRESELLSSESDLSENEAVRVQTEGIRNASLEMFSFLVGLPVGTFILKESPPSFLKESLETYLARAGERADIAAASVRTESLEKQRAASERERWPTVALDGAYNPVDAPRGEQTGSLLLSMELPLFDGGRIDAHIAQKEAALEGARLRREEINRRIERDVRVSYSKLVASQAEVSKLQSHVAKATRAYEAQKADYAQGVVNNLDVLQAIRSLQGAKRRLLRARYDVLTNQVALLVAAGGIAK